MHRILGRSGANYWLLFAALEALLIAASCCGFFYYRFSNFGGSAVSMAAFAAALSLSIVVLMHSGGLYAAEALRDFKRALWRLALLTAPIFALAVWTTGALAKNSHVPIYPYRWQWTVLLTALWLGSAVFLRLALRQAYKRGALARRVIAVARTADVTQLRNLSRDCDEPFQVVGEVDPCALTDAAASQEILSGLATNLRASEIVISLDEQSLPWHSLAYCRLSGVSVTSYRDFSERASRRVDIERAREDWIALSRGLESTALRTCARRATHFLFAMFGIVATAPVSLLTAIAIKLEDGGPVFYRQERIGLHGRPFKLLKFRSMREDAELDGVPAWACECDGRVTTVGRIIRKLRIDELPQFWNVVRGDMSVVGPRPERPFFVRQFSQAIPFYDYRHMVRPGITGWAQVSFRYTASLEDTRRKLSYDLYYIKNRGLLLDLSILLRTIGVVLGGEGAR